MRNLSRSAMAAVTAGALLLLNSVAFAQTIETMPPVVVKTVPEAGSKDVKPGEVEIRVTFSKDMADGSWTWSDAWDNASAETIGAPHFEADHRTCVLKVKLEPNKTYGYWINSQKHANFTDTNGRPAIPYLLVFRTKGE